VGKNVPGCRVVLADWSEGAIRIAKQNIRRNELSSTVSCLKADALSAPSKYIGTFNVIVSNPPYIRRGEMETLDHSVRDFEPHMALDGGEDGLDFYRAIAKNWKQVLRVGGSLLFEVGYDQAENVERILAQEGFSNISSEQDTNGIWRVVQGKLPG
jgi:release factor glutamine methyltransferase